MLKKFMPVSIVVAVLLSTLVGAAAPATADEGFEFMYFPLQGLDSHFSNDWGNPRDGGERTHKGTDVFAPKLTPIVAVADGFVTEVGSSKRPGNQVRMRHANGWETWYFHLNNDTPGTDDNRGGTEFAFAPGIEEGMFVAAGTVIAYVGDSGNAEPTESHLHFELHRGGRAINPYPYLSQALNRQRRVIQLVGSLEVR